MLKYSAAFEGASIRSSQFLTETILINLEAPANVSSDIFKTGELLPPQTIREVVEPQEIDPSISTIFIEKAEEDETMKEYADILKA